MKGWQFETTHKPLEIVEKPDPIAKPGYVTIDVKACGLCHSDVGALEEESWLSLISNRPCYLGHEFAGVITGVGEGVEGYKVGDKVGVCPMFGFDGTGPSYGRDGGYATKSTATAEMLVPIPEGVSFAQAAACTDAGMTSYHAMVTMGGIKPGMKVGIMGIGGLGQIGARVAVIMGCEVYVASRNPAARELAMSLGVTAAYETVEEMAKHECEVIVDFAGAEGTTARCLEAVGKYGRVVVVGMAKLESTINTMTLILKQASVVGSNGGTPEDIAALYKMIASGDLDPLLTPIHFDEIGEGLARLKKGGVKGRMVAIMNEEDWVE